MKINELRGIKIDVKNFSFKKAKDYFLDFLLNKFGAIFMAIFLTASIIAGIIIYRYIFNSEWSDNKKDEYKLQIKSNRVSFDEDRFEDIIIKINKQKNASTTDLVIPRDIFRNDTE